ncbi:N-acetylmuramoyl-L-alanine amidase [Luteolibacter ambystomatis]|uniref:N-acetylmuramoyl-L-alanine amidase n=1 Tax=Luteolibacter ambystomatis TaxID=2824561 RepID=A0A975G7L6_9BACT|nr:N-acetylmuramoyl-L-alanine amidase [Luteolibacter ambystomatis]QUE50817.1 N-acetylmuramoyl-L-alanine amidase [Luteolibacter ambystomatis]
MKRALLLLPIAGLLASCGVSTTGGDANLQAPSSWGNMRVTSALVQKGTYGRHRIRPMTPRYITIHATENFSAGGTARAHAEMLRTGSLKGEHNSLGYIIWHYTVDDHSIYQTQPCNEQGQHADYEGQGNRESIGIEMCENRGNSREVTLDRTAKLAALLMKRYGIPLSRIVPHQHWLMIRYDDHRDLGHKTCPHFLVKGGESDPAWQAFLARVARYRAQL